MANIGKEKPKHAMEPILKSIKQFLELEAVSGLILVAAAALALFLANSSFAPYYEAVFDKHTHFLVNDGLMAIFFLMIGLEIKREIVDGELSTGAKALFPIATALGGVIAPALIFLIFNISTENARGWAIPCATDIAFSLGVLALFGSRVPYSLKIFLMALAVIDDLAAILIIAVFYTSELSFIALALAAVCITVLFIFNRRGVQKLWPYLWVGFFLWLAVLASGVHATIAGVILGLMLPMRMNPRVVERIHPFVSYGIMPLFAFANAGVAMQNLQLDYVMKPLPLGIILGLFLGKQLGIGLVAAALVVLRKARLPEGVNWLQFYAVSVLAGIGFTMSLFIGDLAFSGKLALLFYMKIGVLLGSLFSAVVGCALMAIAIQPTRVAKE
jgi:NhaA family Na+:H+ antiporter